MENIRRQIRLFFVVYGGLLFQIIGITVGALFAMNVANSLYVENKKDKILENKVEQKQEIINKEKEDINFISDFLNYCNDENIEEAYNILSQECIREKFQTLKMFEEKYINKTFNSKKEYKIEKEEDLYKITIMQTALEAGSIENRKSTIHYYRIEENIFGKTIYIERY